MNNEKVIQKLIHGSIQRAWQECAAAVLVIIAFTALLVSSAVGSPRFYGSLIILVGTGFIAGVVWSNALSFQLLRSHAPSEVEYWREVFQAQARLLRWVPLWYCAPICVGGIVMFAPTSSGELVLFLLNTTWFIAVFVGVTVLNRRGANKIDAMATQLT
ncbi:MAG: hypothetical protein U0840_27455 [Gemmataceae bacterium]